MEANISEPVANYSIPDFPPPESNEIVFSSFEQMEEDYFKFCLQITPAERFAMNTMMVSRFFDTETREQNYWKGQEIFLDTP